MRLPLPVTSPLDKFGNHPPDCFCILISFATTLQSLQKTAFRASLHFLAVRKWLDPYVCQSRSPLIRGLRAGTRTRVWVGRVVSLDAQILTLTAHRHRNAPRHRPLLPVHPRERVAVGHPPQTCERTDT